MSPPKSISINYRFVLSKSPKAVYFASFPSSRILYLPL